MSIGIYLAIEDVGSAIASDPEELVELLADLAYRTAGDERFFEDVAAAHSGSKSHDAIAPFLRELADALEAAA